MSRLVVASCRKAVSYSNRALDSALGIWGRAEMGSDGLNRILTGSALSCLVPLKTREFKGF